jgi:hypothetical protein
MVPGPDDEKLVPSGGPTYATIARLAPGVMSDNGYSVRFLRKRKAEMSDLRKVEMSPSTLLKKTWEGCFGVVDSERARFAADRGPD